MKPFLLILCVLAFSFSGCKKCWECNTWKSNGIEIPTKKVCDQSELKFYEDHAFRVDSGGYTINGNGDTVFYTRLDTTLISCD